jgi:hypothetical protein
VCVFVCVCVCEGRFVNIYATLSTRRSVWSMSEMFLYIYVCLYTYIYIHTYIYICTYIVGGTGGSGEGRGAETTGANLDVAPVGALSGGEKSGMWRRSLRFLSFFL